MKIKLAFGIGLVTLFVVVSPFFVFGENVVKNVTPGEEDWRYLKLAENAYEEGDYGEAITYAEQAKLNRRQNNDWKIYTLENTIRLPDVRKAGDLLEDVMPVLIDHNQKDAINIINILLESRNSDVFKGSFSQILEYLETNYYYPEADFLIGKIYRLEGEIDLAYSFMNQAYNHADKLDVPDEKYEILYELADLSMDNGKEEDYEKYMLLVLKDDPLYMDNAFTSAMLRIVNDDRRVSVEKFFMLYRSENYNSLKALEGLSDFYSKKGEDEKALKCAALGSITSLTKITSTLKSRVSGYSYTSFENMLYTTGSFSDIIEWGSSNGIWELYYNFASICAVNGKTEFSKELYDILSRAEPVDYWKVLARNKI